ncbi:MAG: hypothetical protein HKN35_13710 [Woeseia sp.]|nr:hypothetical protein [Woeseia sp.]
MSPISRWQRVVAVASILLLAACGKDDAASEVFSDADSPLRYVDADTPYLFAALEPLPDDIYEKIEPRMKQLMSSYQDVIRLSLLQSMEHDGDGEELSEEDQQRVTAVLERVLELFSSEGLREAGFDRESKVMLYGKGLLPVLRISLSDADAFEETLAAVEADAGTELQVAKLDDVTYRFGGDDNARVVLAVIDEQVVASIVPTGLSEDSLREIFGLKMPAQPMSKSGRLAEISKTYGFSAHGAGFVDFQKIVSTFTDEQVGVNAELLKLTDFDAEQLSDVCKSEIRGVSAIAPRLVSGYTEFTDERMASTTVLELRSDIADGMATLPALVPGLGGDHGGLFSFGMSIDLLAAREFYEARLDALEADPFKCELFAELQAGVAKGRAALNQPIPPIAYGLKGFVAVVDNIEGLNVATKQPPTEIDMRFLLATDNAPGLVAMGSMFSPELAMLGLKPDGKAVRFTSPMMQGPVEEAWVAMNENSVALAVGEDAEDNAGGMLAKQGSTPPPVFAMDMDASRYYSFVGDAITMRSDEESSPELNEAVQTLMDNLAALIDRVSVRVNFTDRGVEIPAVTTLKD